MKYLLYLVAAITLVSSCSVFKKGMKGKSEPEPAAVEITAPIKEVEEKLVPMDEVKPDPSSYFVIIGSFRSPDNARTYQKEISKEGFASEILKNEEGLFRVSVMATDDIAAARKNILQIRENFPQHADTWLLIQKK